MTNFWPTETRGIWTAEARLALPDEHGHAVVTLYRRNERVATLSAFRFPIGWRSGDIDRASVPLAAKALARRVMRQLP